MTQRDLMRELYKIHGKDRDAIVVAYADAEKCGKVSRKQNSNNTSVTNYAKALYLDGMRKGWIAQ